MSRLIAFDFDGVVVDSISTLKSVYYDFLTQFGKIGSETEFDYLNGAKISDIVFILKKNYKLEDRFEILVEKYYRLISEAYSVVPLVKGVKSVINQLYNNGVDLALVTSSKRSEVESILRHHGIDDKFKFFVFGDDVTKAKPSPEIYLLLQSIANEYEIWAIEDSDNGIRSAREANINVVFFDQYNGGTRECIDCRISDIREILALLDGVCQAYSVIEQTSKLEIEILENYAAPVTQIESDAIDKLWNKAKAVNSVHEDNILYYLRHESIRHKVRIQAFWAPFKYFFCSFHHPLLAGRFVPLAVSGICFDRRGFVLTGKRKNVNEYPDKIELVPSGGISENLINQNDIDPRQQILTELFEEALISPESVLGIKVLGIVRDLKNCVVDICYRVELAGPAEIQTTISEEYTFLTWNDLSELDREELIPTSRAILSLVEGK